MYEVHFAGFDHYNRASFEMVTLQQGFWKLMRPWTGKLLLALKGERVQDIRWDTAPRQEDALECQSVHMMDSFHVPK